MFCRGVELKNRRFMKISFQSLLHNEWNVRVSSCLANLWEKNSLKNFQYFIHFSVFLHGFMTTKLEFCLEIFLQIFLLFFFGFFNLIQLSLDSLKYQVKQTKANENFATTRKKVSNIILLLQCIYSKLNRKVRKSGL